MDQDEHLTQTEANGAQAAQARRPQDPLATAPAKPAQPSNFTTASSYGSSPTLERFPRAQRFLLGDRIQRTALDVLESLVEATYTRRRQPPLTRANLGIEKLRFLLRLAHDLRYLDRRRYEHAARCLDETGRKIGAWMKAHRARKSA